MKIKLSEYARSEGLTYRTALRHYHEGRITGAYQISTGSVFVELPDSSKEIDKDKGAALYSRVSSSQNKDNLERQQKRLEDYAAARGYTIKYNVTEIGSGLNDQRNKLNNLLSKDDWSVLIVEHKDRLTRFGFNFIRLFLEKEGRTIEVINVAEDKDDLVQDFISVITSFSSRIYGRRRTHRQTENLIKELNTKEEPANG